jgi:hypothetical protein
MNFQLKSITHKIVTFEGLMLAREEENINPNRIQVHALYVTEGNNYVYETFYIIIVDEDCQFTEDNRVTVYTSAEAATAWLVKESLESEALKNLLHNAMQNNDEIESAYENLIEFID